MRREELASAIERELAKTLMLYRSISIKTIEHMLKKRCAGIRKAGGNIPSYIGIYYDGRVQVSPHVQWYMLRQEKYLLHDAKRKKVFIVELIRMAQDGKFEILIRRPSYRHALEAL